MRITTKSIFLSIIFLPLFLGVANGQSHIDSLELRLEYQNDPIEKTLILKELTHNYKYVDIDKSLKYAKQMLQIYEDADNEEGIGKIDILLSEIYWIKTEYDTAMYFAQRSYESAKENKNNKDIARSYVMIGAVYISVDDYGKSSEYYFKALRIYEDLGDRKNVGLVLNNIGKIFSEQRKYNKAREYFSQSLSIAEEVGDTIGIVTSLTNLSSVFANLKEFDKSMRFMKLVLPICETEGMKPWLGTNYLNLGITNQQLFHKDTAIYYYNQAIIVFEELKDENFLTQTYYNVARYYLELGKYQHSISFATDALEKGKKYGFKRAVYEAADILRQNYINLYETDSAYKYAMLQYSTKDSLDTQENFTKLTKLEFQFNIEKDRQQKLINDQRRDFIIAIVFVLLVLMIVMVVSFALRQRLKAKNNLLEKQQIETELASTNKELTTNAMYLVKKNELLTGISEKLVEIERDAVKEETKDAIHRIARELQKSKDEDAWEEFELRFNQVHSNYYKNLKSKYPDLTPNDLRLCALLKLNMSTKEISDITGQRLGTIEMARSRIRKKIGISGTDTNLIDFLSRD